LIVVSSIACGQKGPPLPPIVRTPVAPVISANRRGSAIELALTVPSANVDGSRPANLTRIDIYAVNGAAATMTDLEMMKRGTKVASVPVKSPRNPDDAVEQGDPAEDAEPTVGEGLEQGSSSAIAETITASLLAPLPPRRSRREAVATEPEGPLIGPAAMFQLRTYVGVGLDRHGNPGQFSRRVSVPLVLPPLPPPPIAIYYEERKIIVTWKPLTTEADSVNVLPSQSFGPLQPQVTYNLYDATTGQLLNPKPIKEFGYEDTRMDWGTKRCYLVRSVEVVARIAVESEPAGPACEVLVDTFAPAAPKGLNAVSTDGAINLIWDANTEPDLAGYFVLRASGPDAELFRLTLEPVTDAQFFDGVQRGVRFTYAVQAVDKAGNVSKPSERVEETAR
jgi:hypothetical protein